MPSLVSEALMEATWQAIGAMSSAQALQLQKANGKRQQELVGFVIAFSSELRPEVATLVHYIFLVVAEAFHQTGVRLREVKPAKIMREWKRVSELIASGVRTEGAEALRAASNSPEPAVSRYVVEALSPDQEDPVFLADEEAKQARAILETVIACLHEVQKAR